MNMPFEFGVDFGHRLSGGAKYKQKKFLVFEKNRFDLKSSLSDIAGQDAEYHEAGDSGAEEALKSVRMVPRRVGTAA